MLSTHPAITLPGPTIAPAKFAPGEVARITISPWSSALLGIFAKAVAASKLRFDLPGTELAALDVAIGKAYAQQEMTTDAVDAFARALDRVEEDEEKKKINSGIGKC